MQLSVTNTNGVKKREKEFLHLRL